MEQFSYYTPTKVVFGKGAELKAGEMIRSYGFLRRFCCITAAAASREAAYMIRSLLP